MARLGWLDVFLITILRCAGIIPGSHVTARHDPGSSPRELKKPELSYALHIRIGGDLADKRVGNKVGNEWAKGQRLTTNQ